MMAGLKWTTIAGEVHQHIMSGEKGGACSRPPTGGTHRPLTLEKVEVRHRGKRYLLRTPLKGVCGKVLQGAGVAIPPSVREVNEERGAKTSSQAL